MSNSNSTIIHNILLRHKQDAENFNRATTESNIKSCIYCKRFYITTMADQCDIPRKILDRNPDYIATHQEPNIFINYYRGDQYGHPTKLNNTYECPYFEYRWYYKVLSAISNIKNIFYK